MKPGVGGLVLTHFKGFPQGDVQCPRGRGRLQNKGCHPTGNNGGIVCIGWGVSGGVGQG